jgi:hypothetical protein
LSRRAQDLAARGRIALLILLAIRLVLHALFVPAYEGPDETAHLSRIVDYADHPLAEAFRGRPLNGTVLAAVAARPCTAALRGLDCPPFGTSPASFNLLHPVAPLAPRSPSENLENNQPPLFYMLVGLALRLPRAAGLLLSPDSRLLAARLLGTLSIMVAVCWPLRRLAARWESGLVLAGILVLLLPGAAESLVRCANDQAVFLWAAFALLALERRAPIAVLAILMAAGPLLKLTALPVSAFVLTALWLERRRFAACFGLFSTCLVFPVQLWRGWWWGGTYELNRPGPSLAEPLLQTMAGLARSGYTVLKTTFWLGEWTFFRAPSLLVLSFFALGAACLLAARLRSAPQRAAAHLVAAICASVGILIFALANHRFFGVWGGVGGWYAWGWFPWLMAAASDLATLESPTGRRLLLLLAVFVTLTNVCFYWMAFRLYG